MNLTELIAENIGQLDIFAYYLEVNKYEIISCLMDKNRRINNPLRDDNTPSLGFMRVYEKGKASKIRMKDFARNEYSGDCYDLVAIKLKKSINVPTDFVEICNDILKNLLFNRPEHLRLTSDIVKPKKEKLIRNFDVYSKNWNNYYFKYWFDIISDKRPHIINTYIKFITENVKVLDAIYDADNSEVIYRNYKDELAYCYILNTVNNIQTYQFYFPNRNKKGKLPKFQSNNTDNIFDLKPYESSKTLVLIKSNKDKLLLAYSFMLLRGNDPNVLIKAIRSEAVRLSEEEVIILNKNFKNIIMFLDFDMEGIFNGFYHTQLGIKVIYIPSIAKLEFNRVELINFINRLNVKFNTTHNEMSVIKFVNSFRFKKKYLKVKDYADFIHKFGIDTSIKLINKLINLWSLN